MSLAEKLGFLSVEDFRQAYAQIQRLQRENQTLRIALSRAVSAMRKENRATREEFRKSRDTLSADFGHLLARIEAIGQETDAQIRLLRDENADLKESLSGAAATQARLFEAVAALDAKTTQIEANCAETMAIASQLKELSMLLLVSDLTGRLPNETDV